MRAALIASLALPLLAAIPANAATPQAAPIENAQSLYTCTGNGLSRVSFAPQAPCCTGQLGCPQLLSNTGLVKARRENRT